jgi:hypothetical protein
MAKLPQLKRILKQDFSADDHSMIDKLGSVINPFMEEVVSSFNKQLNLDNMSWELKSFKIACDANGLPINEVQFKTSLSAKIKGMLVISANNQTNSNTYPASAPFISFTTNGQVIIVKHITGLQANNDYYIQAILIS